MKISMLVSSLESQLAEAAMAYALFTGMAPARASKEEWRANRDTYSLRVQRITASLEAKETPLDIERSSEPSGEEMRRFGEQRYWYEQELRQRAELEVHREDWQAGRLAEVIRHHIPFIHAKGFLYAAEMIGKLIGALGGCAGLAPELATLGGMASQFESALPDLGPVRDSVQHLDERVQGKAYNKPLPNPSGGTRPAGRLLIIDNLNGTRFGCTTSDGTFREIDVSETTLRALRDHIQACVDAIPWDDSMPSVFPRGW